MTSPTGISGKWQFHPRPMTVEEPQPRPLVVYECHRCRRRWAQRRAACTCDDRQILHPVFLNDTRNLTIHP